MATNPVPPSSPLLLSQGEVVEPIPDLVEQLEIPGSKIVIMRMTKFASEYIINGFDGPAAAIAAGYSRNYAAGQASRLLRTSYVQHLLRQHRGELEQRTGITAEAVVNELAKIGFANMSRFVRLDESGDPYYDFTEATEDDWAAVTELNIETTQIGNAIQKRVKFKLGPKAQALHDLGEYFKLFTRKNELTGPNGTPLIPPTVTVKFSKKGAVNVSASGDVHRSSNGSAQAEGPEADSSGAQGAADAGPTEVTADQGELAAR